jgi:hypothetical protein
MRSVNGGEKWMEVGIDDKVAWLAADAKRPRRIYLSGQKGVYQTDGGQTWKLVGGPRVAGRLAVDSLGRLYLAAAEASAALVALRRQNVDAIVGRVLDLRCRG